MFRKVEFTCPHLTSLLDPRQTSVSQPLLFGILDFRALPARPERRCTRFPAGNLLTRLFPIVCRLFCIHKKLNPFAINRFPPLCEKQGDIFCRQSFPLGGFGPWSAVLTY